MEEKRNEFVWEEIFRKFGRRREDNIQIDPLKK
jgi:hypothetical protein